MASIVKQIEWLYGQVKCLNKEMEELQGCCEDIPTLQQVLESGNETDQTIIINQGTSQGIYHSTVAAIYDSSAKKGTGLVLNGLSMQNNGAVTHVNHVDHGDVNTPIEIYFPGVSGNLIVDAPSDGTIYGRKDGEWVSAESSIPPIEDQYSDIVTMLIDQPNQLNNFIYYVGDATPEVTAGYAYFEYLGTTNGNISDYRMISAEEWGTGGPTPPLEDVLAVDNTSQYGIELYDIAEPNNKAIMNKSVIGVTKQSTLGQAIYMTDFSFTMHRNGKTNNLYANPNLAGASSDIIMPLDDGVLITDAPSNANQYARQGGAWTVVTLQQVLTADNTTDKDILSSGSVKSELGDLQTTIAPGTVSIKHLGTSDRITLTQTSLGFYQGPNNLKVQSTPLTLNRVQTLQDKDGTIALLDDRLVNLDPTTLTYFCDQTSDGQTQNIGREIISLGVNNSAAPVTSLAPKVFIILEPDAVHPTHGDGELVSGSGLYNGAKYGINTTDALVGEKMKITRLGDVGGVDTSAWVVGTPLFVDPNTPGEVTSTVPTLNAYLVGVVEVQDVANGVVAVNTITAIDLISNTEVFGGVPYYFTGEVSPVVGTSLAVLPNSKGALDDTVLAVVDDNQIVAGDKSFILDPALTTDSQVSAGVYQGKVQVQQSLNSANERVYVEIYVADAAGVPVDIAPAGVPGSLGINAVVIHSSAILNLQSNTTTDVSLSAEVITPIPVLAGQTFYYLPLFEKIGTAGGAKNFTMFVGATADSYIQGLGTNAANLVPYVGATQPVDLGVQTISAANFNGVPLTTGGVATNYLDETGAYSAPPASSGPALVAKVDGVTGALTPLSSDGATWVGSKGGTGDYRITRNGVQINWDNCHTIVTPRTQTVKLIPSLGSLGFYLSEINGSVLTDGACTITVHLMDGF